MNNLISNTGNTVEEIRCFSCGKMLAKPIDFFGMEIKCLRCGNLNRIFEKMVEQVVITDKNGFILFINKAAEETTGYNAHEAIGKKPSDLWGGHMSKNFYVDMWNKVKNKKESVRFKIINKKKNGDNYNVELLVSPIFDTNGDILFFVGIEIVV